MDSELKTPPAFRNNMESIIRIASQRNEQPIVVTLAWYVPSNYTLEAFRRKTLDYGTMRYPIELWGIPSNVVAGIQAHNEVVRQLGSEHPESILVDAALEVPPSGLYFDDICHLTDEGCEILASEISHALIKVWRQKHSALDNGKSPHGRA